MTIFLTKNHGNWQDFFQPDEKKNRLMRKKNHPAQKNSRPTQKKNRPTIFPVRPIIFSVRPTQKYIRVNNFSRSFAENHFNPKNILRDLAENYIYCEIILSEKFFLILFTNKKRRRLSNFKI